MRQGLLSFAATGFVCAALFQPAAEAAIALQPVVPQPVAVSPGLPAVYFYQKFEDVRDVEKLAQKKKGSAGGPIPRLDHRAGNGKIFDTTVRTDVGMLINGLIRFPAPGDWQIQVRSNDGVRVKIADQEVILDPDIHTDRFSKPVAVTVPAAGWYKLDVSYFQATGGAALEFYWIAPGGKDRDLIPAEAYGHGKP